MISETILGVSAIVALMTVYDIITINIKGWNDNEKDDS
jgi:hypothetical protein